MVASINASTSAGVVTTADTSGILQLQTASTAAVTITAAQNVGIGTASPAQKLHVSDTTTSTVKTRTEASTGYVDVGMGGNSGVFDTTATDGIRLRTSGNDRLAIDTSGNVGIGTTSPTATGGYDKAIDLVGGSNGAGLYIRGATNPSTVYAAIQYDNGANRTNINAVGTNNFMRFVTVDTERMRITSGGNLLIGTSASTINIYTQVNHATGSSSGASFFVSSYNGTQIGDIAQNGTTGVLYNITSDYRLKNNPVALTGAKDFVMALQPKTWDWWDDSGKGVGFIAHEFMEVAKYSGHGEKDAVDADGKPIYQSIQPSSSEVMANIVALMQEQQTTITAQAETINALTARIVALEGA